MRSKEPGFGGFLLGCVGSVIVGVILLVGILLAAEPIMVALTGNWYPNPGPPYLLVWMISVAVLIPTFGIGILMAVRRARIRAR